MPILCPGWMLQWISCQDLRSSVAWIYLQGIGKWKPTHKIEKRLPFQLAGDSGNIVGAMALKNAPPTFQRLLELVLNGVDWQHVFVYIGDICLFSTTFEHHLALLREVLTKLKVANLKLKPSKCQLFQASVLFLGHEVSASGVRPDPANTEKVAMWKTPQNASELLSFLCLASYYRKFCPNFATITEPLQRLTESKYKFQWTQECNAAFKQLRERLTTSPLLAYPKFDDSFRLNCDASNYAIGAVLSQGDWNEERVIAYASKSLNAS